MASPPIHSPPLPALTSAAAPAAEATGESLLERLAHALDSRRVAYCQWKGHWSAHRWASGHGDVDLLVAHDDLSRFRQLVGELGFKLAHPSAYRWIAGVESYFGHDPAVDRLLHLHVHYRLVLGDSWRPVYRIPIERPMLEESVAAQPFRLPSPSYQFLIFVLRMMLRQVGRPLLSAKSRWISGIQIQLASLEASSDRDELGSILSRHLTALDPNFLNRCVRSLQGECGRLERALLPWQLHRRLRSHVRRPSIAALAAAAVEKLLPVRLAYRLSSKSMRLAGGGTVVALIGGDGAGKSTCARELSHWLAPAFPTMRAHLGNPPRSLLTWLVGGALKLQRRVERLLNRTSRPGTLVELLRHLCTARDRYLLYGRVQRFAVAGGIAVCERYPIEQNRFLVGPVIPELLSTRPSPVARWLRAAEASYYARILGPDVLCVLRLDPEMAVLRKPDEPAEYVRARGRVIWETDWNRTRAHVVDASQPLAQVMQELKSIIWSAL